MAVRSSNVARQVVLVVEDQPFVRLVTMDMIAECGFAVVGASDADEALGILAGRPDIGFVFSDIDMPGSMDGRAMANMLAVMKIPVRVVLTSGRSSLEGQDDPAHHAFLSKPYLQEDVVRVLTGMLH